MIRKPFFIIPFMVLIAITSACNTIAPPEPTSIPTDTPLPTATNTPALTPTPAPTDTPQPTDTPVPTDTPIPTDTPDFAATQAVIATQQAAEAIAKINAELESYQLSTEEGYLGWMSDEATPIRVTDYLGERWQPIDPTLKVADFILKVDVTWDSTSGLAGCGLIFRGEDNLDKGEQYRFYTLRLSGLPAWDVEYWQYGKWQSTTTGRPKFNNMIDLEAGATNTYVLVMKDKLLSVHANGSRLSNVIIPKLIRGQIAFLTFQESGETTCTFDNAWLWVLE